MISGDTVALSKQNIKKIAVTGGAASGKSTVCNYLDKKGLPVIRLDDLAREVVKPGMPAHGRIVSYFGPDILCADGSLNRSVLRERITCDPVDKKRLEGWVQPAILREMNRRIDQWEQEGRTVVVVEIPLLFELGMERLFDLSILVAVSPEIQIRRLMDRDKVSEESARALIKIQMSLEEKAKKADLVVTNNEEPEDLWLSMDQIFERYFENINQIPKALDR